MNLMQRILGKWYHNPTIKLIFEVVFVILPIAFVIRTCIFGLYQVPTGSMEPTLLVGERFFADKLSYWFRKPVRGEIIAFNDPTYKYSDNQVVNWFERYVSWNVSNWTKRLIAIPGDHIKGVIEDGKPVIYLNGNKLDETAYVNKYPIIYLWKYPQYRYSNSNLADAHLPRTYDPSLPWDQQKFYKIDPNSIILNSSGQPALILYPNTPASSGIDVFDITLGDNQYWAMGDNRLGSSDSRVFGILDGKQIHGKIVFRIFSMDTDESWWFIDLIKNPISFWKKVRWSRCFEWVK